MANLFDALGSSSSALRTFQQALTVTQNNVANASTPGYARQIQPLQALPFDVRSGLSGGVVAGPVASARNSFAETAVQRQVTDFGSWTQQAETLNPLQEIFDVTGKSGVPGALTDLFSSVSTWADSPNDTTARDGVLSSARSVADAFRSASRTLAGAASSADRQISNVVDRANTLIAQLRDANAARQKSSGPDAGLDAQVSNALEELSELVPITTLPQDDGTTSVYLNGQTALVVGDRQFDLQAQFTGAGAQILDSQGNDVSPIVSAGRVGGLLEARNTVLPSLSGSLDRLAQTFADRVNGILTSGLSSDGPPPVGGTPLFTYDPANPGGVAGTLALDPNITAATLAAIDPGPPRAANGIAVRLADLASPRDDADRIDGMSYTEFFGKTAGALGSAVATAQTNASRAQDQATQARDLRQQISGVSLDEEAVKVLEFQRSYQAASKMITVLDGLLQTIIDMAPR